MYRRQSRDGGAHCGGLSVIKSEASAAWGCWKKINTLQSSQRLNPQVDKWSNHDVVKTMHGDGTVVGGWESEKARGKMGGGYVK